MTLFPFTSVNTFAFTKALIRGSRVFPPVSIPFFCAILFTVSLAGRGYAVDHWQVFPQEVVQFPDFTPAGSLFEQGWNVVGTYRPRVSAGRSLILNGHIDIVPSSPEAMRITPPFEPHNDQGWLYGCGAGDMKTELAASIFAVET